MANKQIEELRAIINSGEIPNASTCWGMHEGGFLDKNPETMENVDTAMFYIVTPHALNASWLMMRLKEIFESIKYSGNRYDFYIPVLESAQAAVKQDPDISVVDLCNVILDSAEKFFLKQ